MKSFSCVPFYDRGYSALVLGGETFDLEGYQDLSRASFLRRDRARRDAEHPII